MEALLRRRERRGMTLAELAEESGVPETTLRWWQNRAPKAKRKSAARSAFVEVSVADPPHPECGIEVSLRSGIILRVNPGFDPDHLRRIVQTLEPGC